MQPNAPIIPPTQTAFVLTVAGLIVLAFGCMIVLKVAIFLAEKRAGVEYRWEQPAHAEPGPIRRWMDAHAARVEARYTPRRYVAMSSWEDEENESVSDPVCIPVFPDRHTGADMGATMTGIPDMDAESDNTPLRDIITVTDLATHLARIKRPDGKYHMSANKIVDAVGGDRNTVLAIVRDARADPPALFRQPDGSTAPAARPVTRARA